ncbi:MAG: hypothetical protein KBC32_11390 [Candidatus Didemnitutus sp.]|nr:hypothetical protein [Candidatus Didemnitutus sp.]
MKLRILFCLVVCLGGCRDNHAGDRAVSVSPPKSFQAIAEQKTSADLEKILGEFEIRPRRGRLSREEMLSLVTIFMQIDSLADAHKMGVVCLPSSCDLFASLDASLSATPGWDILQQRAQTTGKIELFSVSAFIEASQRKSR